MHHDPRENDHDTFDHLERGLCAGFGAVDRSVRSVLASLERRTGSSLRLSLPDPGAERDPLVKPTPATRAGSRYEIVGEVARGGLGVVLEGRDVDLGRSVAIKVLHERFHDDRAVIERFVEEAQIGGQLQHPGIVPVYELGLQADDRPFFAMKLIKGDTLAELLRRRPSAGASVARLLDVFLRICQTVAYAHSRRVVHRDLKPSNVLVGRFGEVQVLDWGLAKVLRRGGVADGRPARPLDASRIETVRSGPGSTASIAGSVMGTPAYMPPEQARGEIERLDERADVFALGAILCEILTGRPLYESDDPGEALHAAAEARQGPALERLAAAGSDPKLAALVRACIAPGPDSRPADAGEVAARVEAHLASTQERARAAEVRAAVLRVRARSTAVVAAVVLGALVAGGAAFHAWLRAGWERERDTTARAGAALAEAERFAGQAQQAGLGGAAFYAQALAAARSASAIVTAGRAEPALEERVATRVEELERAEADTRAAALREASHEVWLERLREVRIGPDVVYLDFRDGPGRQAREASRRVAEYAALFGELGFDADVTSAEEALDLLDCAHRAEFARGLDAWAEAERVHGVFTSEPDPEAWRRLVRVARRLDPDQPWRNAMRDELARPELDAVALAALAAPEGAPLTAEEVALVVSLLDAAGDLETAARVQAAALGQHPTDFFLQMSMASLLSSKELLAARYEAEAVRAISAAASLRPDSRVARFALALHAYTDGDSPAGAMGDLLAEDPENPVIATWSFMLTMRRGDFEAAAELLPDVLDDLAATDTLGDYHNFLLLHGHGERLLERSIPADRHAFVNLGLERYDEAFDELEEARASSVEAPWHVFRLAAFREAASPADLRALHRRLLSLAEATPAELAAVPGEEALAAAEALAFAWSDLPAAVRLFARAFEADPALEERRRFARARAEAACFAAVGSADASPASRDLAPDERAELRALARGWLHEELDVIEDELAQPRLAPEQALHISRTLNGIRVYGWPAPIREERYLRELDPDEAAACRFLWARWNGVHRMFDLLVQP